MTAAEMAEIRHATERGRILETLAADYSSEMTSMSSLIAALDLMGVSCSVESMAFHLQYLVDSEYIKVWRNRDIPGRRPPGAASDVRFLRLQPKGLQLRDGHIKADPMVRF